MIKFDLKKEIQSFEQYAKDNPEIRRLKVSDHIKDQIFICNALMKADPIPEVVVARIFEIEPDRRMHDLLRQGIDSEVIRMILKTESEIRVQYRLGLESVPGFLKEHGLKILTQGKNAFIRSLYTLADKKLEELYKGFNTVADVLKLSEKELEKFEKLLKTNFQGWKVTVQRDPEEDKGLIRIEGDSVSYLRGMLIHVYFDIV